MDKYPRINEIGLQSSEVNILFGKAELRFCSTFSAAISGLIIFALSVNSNFAGGKIQEISTSYRQNLLSQQMIISPNTHFASDKKISMMQLALNEQTSSSTDKSSTQKDNSEKNNKIEKQNSDKRDKREFFTKWF